MTRTLTFDYDGETGWVVEVRRAGHDYVHVATVLSVDGILLTIPSARPWDVPESHVPVIGVTVP